MMKAEEIRQYLTGKMVRNYNSFNGIYYSFTVGYVKKTGKSIVVQEERNKGPRIYIPINILEELFQTGFYKERFEIDHCICWEEWKIET